MKHTIQKVELFSLDIKIFLALIAGIVIGVVMAMPMSRGSDHGGWLMNSTKALAEIRVGSWRIYEGILTRDLLAKQDGRSPIVIAEAE